MARGFLSGAMVGGVVSVAVAGAASLMSGDLVAPDVSDAAPGSTQAPSVSEGVAAQAAREADVVQEGATASQTPAPDTVSAASAAGADRPTQPVTGTVGALEDPAAVANSAALDVEGEAPVLPSPQANLPNAADRDELAISTDPAQPAAPEVPEEQTAFEQPATQAPTQPQAPGIAEDTAATEDAAEDMPEEMPEEMAETETADTNVAEAGTETDNAAETAPAPEPAPEPEQIAALPSVSEETPPAEGPRIGQPAVSLIERNAQSGTATPDSSPQPGAQPNTEPNTGEDVTEQPPLVAFSEPFERSDDKPLMSIVLIDQGTDLSTGPVGLAALRSFPYPITFAIDPNLPDAAQRMTDYRAQGFEVLAMINLPTGASPTDAEVSLDAAFATLPEVVGVLEGVSTGVQENREASDQVSQILAASGHGFVVQSKGLNTAQKLAARAGVPSATVFRDFDSADQTPTVIRRFLDQAAFRAGQEGGVIMMGRLRADTISALILWGLQDRATRVDLAPVSALLSAQNDGT